MSSITYPVKIGFDIQTGAPIRADLSSTGHFCVAGGTGSGKSMAILYMLNSVLSLPARVELHIADFKKSGDYAGLTEHFSEFDGTTALIDRFYETFEHTGEHSPVVRVLLIDEYAGYILWLMQKDKKKCEEIKGKISNMLMLGRSRNCWVWTVQQRMTAQLFPAGIGAIDNFQCVLGLGRLSVDGRRALFAGEHFDDEAFEKEYHPGQGQGLCLIDGQPLRAVQIPRISDKEKLKALLRKKAQR